MHQVTILENGIGPSLQELDGPLVQSYSNIMLVAVERGGSITEVYRRGGCAKMLVSGDVDGGLE